MLLLIFLSSNEEIPSQNQRRAPGTAVTDLLQTMPLRTAKKLLKIDLLRRKGEKSKDPWVPGQRPSAERLEVASHLKSSSF